jgi:hypothetical protein
MANYDFRDSDINLGMEIPLDMKTHRWNFVIGAVVIVGLFFPWITKGLDPMGQINPETGQGELHYRRQILMSPFYVMITEEGEVTTISWFISTGTTFAGVMLGLSSVLFVCRFHNAWMKISIFLLAFLGVVLFFMSFGVGLSIGLKTEFGWGVVITLVGVGLMFIFSIIELSRDPRLRIMAR